MGEVQAAQSFGQQELEDIIASTLAEARKRGVDQAEVAVSHDIGLAATARLRDVESLEYTNDRGIGVTVYCGSRKGSASTSDISAEAIREAVAKACTFASYTAEDKYAGLADADRMCTELPDLDLDHPWALDAAAAIELAIACEAAALGYDKRISNSEGDGVDEQERACIRQYARFLRQLRQDRPQRELCGPCRHER